MDNRNLEGYESPISMIVHKNTTKILEEREDAIVARISEEIGFDINKEELIKALNYDRNQYSKGYYDGYKRAQSIFERPKGKWINNECPFCGRYENYPENFCATCGADLRGKKNEQ